MTSLVYGHPPLAVPGPHGRPRLAVTLSRSCRNRQESQWHANAYILIPRSVRYVRTRARPSGTRHAYIGHSVEKTASSSKDDFEILLTGHMELSRVILMSVSSLELATEKGREGQVIVRAPRAKACVLGMRLMLDELLALPPCPWPMSMSPVVAHMCHMPRAMCQVSSVRWPVVVYFYCMLHAACRMSICLRHGA